MSAQGPPLSLAQAADLARSADSRARDAYYGLQQDEVPYTSGVREQALAQNLRELQGI